MPSPRLSRADWVAAALTSLAARGHAALRADRLAGELGVSRGSFYWHFPDVGAFERAVLERWERIAVDLPYAIAVGDERRGAADALHRLVAAVFTAPVGLERAVRSWATSSEVAADAVERIDERRLTLLTDMIVRADLAGERGRPDAVVLYCSYLGHVASNAALMDEDALRVIISRLCD